MLYAVLYDHQNNKKIFTEIHFYEDKEGVFTIGYGGDFSHLSKEKYRMEFITSKKPSGRIFYWHFELK